MRFVWSVLFFCVTAALPAAAQAPVWDNSGNKLLSGTYYFREVIYSVADNNGDLSDAVALYGNIIFDGNGNYTLSGAKGLEAQNGSAASAFTGSGTYTISASGYGYLTSPLSTTTATYLVYGMVSNGIFVASTTESQFNDLFIAAAVSSPLATNSSLHGSYTIAGFIPGGTPASMADATYQINPDGNGNLGAVNVSGYAGGGGTTVYTQSNSGLKYFFSNGAAVLTWPTSSTANFYSGQEYLYISADGNFVFGGNPQGFDMFVGVKTPAAGSNTNYNGIYYEAGIDEDTSNLATGGYGLLDTFYGSFNAGGGNIVGHQRLYSPLISSSAEGFTYSDTWPTPVVNGTYNVTGATQYTFGNGGALRIGFGIGPFLGINVAVQAPVLSGSGVFLNPMGVTNAASFAPFTAGVSPGEFITLYGSGLAPSFQVASGAPFPTTLNGVQVTINGLPAPMYYVSSTQIAAIVPYGITYSLAQIKVTNNGQVSNVVTLPANKTTPGVFTLSANGLGYGAIEHAADGSVVTAASPAQPGEFVSIFLSGLGLVFPPVTEGTPASSTTLSNTVSTFRAFIGNTQATVLFAGLAPSLAGLFQVNIQIPAGATAGDNFLDIQGPDGETQEALIPIGTGLLTAARPAAAAPRAHKPMARRGEFVPAASGCFIVASGCTGR
jgi:uncharacterized protein (TIGR03437 family)